MGLFEYLFEKKNPGKIGDIQKNNQPVNQVSVPILIIKFIVSILLIYSLFYVTVRRNPSLANIAIFIILVSFYCFISYLIIPRPDTSNVGLLGGLIDHPFRYSDDVNRMLILISILLLPGRFISKTIIQTIRKLSNHSY